MNKLKNVMSYIAVCIIILASFKMPEILFEMENYSIGSEVYKRQENKSTINVEAEEVYLVKAIYDIESEANKVAITSSNEKGYSIVEMTNEEGEFTNSVTQELLKLTEYNILRFEKNVNSKATMEVVEKSYKKGNSQYIMNIITLKIDDKYYGIEVENKTGKILNINFDRENLNTTNNKEEIMRNYIKYLDLYIIDDWKFENNMLKSEKAELVVNLVENRDKYILSIHTTDKIFEYVYRVN